MKNICSLFSQVLIRSLLAFVFLCLWALASYGQSAKSLLETEIYKLDNGLNIYLNEDHSLPSVYLDSIADLYDKLAATSLVEEKASIQHQINRLSIKASEYAIPNETQKILGEMGNM